MSAISIKCDNKNIRCNPFLPASKSESNRALIINALCNDEKNHLINISDAEDTQILIKVLSSLKNEHQLFDIGAAGTTMRFLTAFFAARKNSNVILTGSQRMKERPIKILVDALNNIGADISFVENNGYPPLKIIGKNLSGGEIIISGSISSQYISALMMIAPVLEKGLTIYFSGEIVSIPYIKMTEKIMKHFGVECKMHLPEKIIIPNQTYKPCSYEIESDWSAASYWYEIAALSESAEIFLAGLKKDSHQGDSKVAEIFSFFGVETIFQKTGILITKEKHNKPVSDFFNYDFSSCPDLAQTIAVTCAGLRIKAELTGLQTLKIKETDRISALIAELKKMGINAENKNDNTLIINTGKVHTTGHIISTYHDHRMAMAFSPLCLITKHISIENPDVVKKSYPGFWEQLKIAGFLISNW